MGIVVMTPTDGELNIGGHVGLLRMLSALRRKRKQQYGLTDDQGLFQHINGAIGEQMTAKHLGVYWSGDIDKIDGAADVGECYQVRATDLRNGKLITHPKDNGHQPFILARILLPDVHLVGWLWGHEAKRQEFWKTENMRYPAFVAWPVHDMATLPHEGAVSTAQREAFRGSDATAIRANLDR